MSANLIVATSAHSRWTRNGEIDFPAQTVNLTVEAPELPPWNYMPAMSFDKRQAHHPMDRVPVINEGGIITSHSADWNDYSYFGQNHDDDGNRFLFVAERHAENFAERTRRRTGTLTSVVSRLVEWAPAVYLAPDHDYMPALRVRSLLKLANIVNSLPDEVSVDNWRSWDATQPLTFTAAQKRDFTAFVGVITELGVNNSRISALPKELTDASAKAKARIRT